MKFEVHIDRNGEQPVYLQIRDQLKSQIKANGLPSGTRMPSVDQVAEFSQCSLHTADLAMKALVDDGICYRQPKKGTFIGPQKETPVRNICALPLQQTAQVQVFNAGICGHNTRQGVNRIDNVLQQYKPTVVVIGYGANDALNSKALVPASEFKANLAGMIAAARKNQVRIIVLNSCNPCIDSYLSARHKYSGDLKPSERVNEYNKLIAETTAEQNVIFNDFHPAVMKKGGASGDRTCLLRNEANSRVEDGLHLTAEGAKLLAETVAEALDGKVKNGDRILCLGDSITYGAGLSGGGTVTGQTYPAWLKTILDHQSG